MPGQLIRGNRRHIQQSHNELIKKRKEKKEKKKLKKTAKKGKEYYLEEFLKLTKEEFKSEKDSAMSIMEIVEEIKDEGMNDKRYMDIMNHLMKIHNAICAATFIVNKLMVLHKSTEKETITSDLRLNQDYNINTIRNNTLITNIIRTPYIDHQPVFSRIISG